MSISKTGTGLAYTMGVPKNVPMSVLKWSNSVVTLRAQTRIQSFVAETPKAVLVWSKRVVF